MLKFRLTTLLLALVALTACEPPPNHLRGSALRTISLSESDPQGVLIVGKPREYRNVHVLVFHSYDAENNLLVSPERGGKEFRFNGGGTAFDIVDEIDDVQYLLQKLPADQYYLTKVHWGPYGQNLLSNGSFAVDVQPGTVTYIGNLDFSLPTFIFGDVNITSINARSDVARDLMAKYPGIKPDMQTVVPTIFKLNCPLEDGFDVCYAP